MAKGFRYSLIPPKNLHKDLRNCRKFYLKNKPRSTSTVMVKKNTTSMLKEYARLIYKRN